MDTQVILSYPHGQAKGSEILPRLLVLKGRLLRVFGSLVKRNEEKAERFMLEFSLSK